MLKKAIWVMLTTMPLLLSACKGIYEKYHTLPGAAWSYANPEHFEFNVKEPGRYRVEIDVKYFEDYKFSNLWLSLWVTDPANKTQDMRFNIPLHNESYNEDQDNGHQWLDGRWQNGSIGVLHERNYPSPDLDNGQILSIDLKQAGNYTFMLRHEMRDDVLHSIFATGVRVKKMD
jgi:gliding motility-associated lipoprotein GldH